jgi:hypothetical protein
MLYRAWLALLVFCTIFTVVGLVDAVSTPPFAAAQNTLTPLEVVEEFYTAYFTALTPDAAGNFENPVTEGTFREMGALSDDLIGQIDARRSAPEGMMADPFLCAQELPDDFSVILAEESDSAAVVLLGERFDLTIRNITVQLENGADGWQISDVLCSDLYTPAGVVEAFYSAYTAYNRYDEAAGTRGNLLVDGAYREMPHLTPGLISALDAQVAGGLMADPLVCAQDVPLAVYGDEVHADDTAALVLARAYFQGNPQPHIFTVSLENGDGGWQIAQIDCATAPETVVELVYRQYAAQVRRMFEVGNGRSLLQNPLSPWMHYLTPDLLTALGEAAAGAPQADALLCAQDVPDAFTVEALAEGVFLVSGLYPSGPETTTAYPLAEVTLTPVGNTWQIAGITCAAR